MKNAVTLILQAILFTSLAVSATAQAEADAPKKPDPEVKEKVQALEDAVSDRRMSQDQAAIGMIEELLVKFRLPMHRSDRRAVQRAVAAVFTTRVREPEKLGLYEAAATALGDMGNEGARVLQRAYADNRRFPKKTEWVPLRAILLENIGKTRSEPVVKFLIDEATRSPEKALMAAAGQALGSFQESKQQVRKEIVKKLLIRWGELDARHREGNTDPFDIEAQTAQEYMAAFSDKWNGTLNKLTGQSFRDHPEWQKWWNDHKNGNWDRDRRPGRLR